MGIFDLFRSKPKHAEKVFNPNWQSIGGSYGPATYDAFHSKPEPTKLELIRSYQETVYACSNLIANKIATTPVKLFVRTNKGEPRPKCLTRPVDYKTLAHVRHVKAYSPDTQVDEVISHPVLECLKRVNLYHNYFELIGITQIWLDLCGNAYWLVKPDSFGIPSEVYPVPPQSIQPVRDGDGFIIAWQVGDNLEQKTYGINEVIHFKNMNPLDPYGEGVSPARAAWQRIQIGYKEVSYLDSVLTNNARPDVVLSPKEPISPIEAERLAKEFGHRFRGQGNGGAIVADQSMTVTPLNFPPRDLAELQLYQLIKTSVCNAFGVPPDVFEMGESNRSTAEASLFALAEHAIKPRMLHLLGKLNERFLPLFDQGQGRLFLEADNIVPDDKAFDLQRDQFLVTQGIVTRQEIRDKYGYPPAEWAAEPLLPPGMMPAFAMAIPGPQDAPGLAGAEADGPEVDPANAATAEQADATSTNDLRATVGGSVAVADLQRSYYRQELPREAAIANAVLIFGFSNEEAEKLFPELAPNAPQAAAAPAATAPGAEAPAAEAPAAPAPGEKKKCLPVPQVRQVAGYDCGAAATLAVCQFFNVGPATEAELIPDLGTTEQDGTSPAQIAGYLVSLGLGVTARNDLDLADLAEATGQGCPVLCCVQDHGSPQAEAALASGHWVVVTGVEGEAVQLMDPSEPEPVAMPGAEFLDRWQDTDGNGVFIRFGIAVALDLDGGELPPEKGKRLTTKSTRLRNPATLAEALVKFFRKQAGAVLARLKEAPDLETKAMPLPGWFDLDRWTREMAEDMRPSIALYWDFGARETVGRIGASVDLLKVVQPQLKKGLDRATFIFCKETNETTSLALGDAIRRLKEELAAGMDAGQVQNELTRRVQTVFDQAEVSRAYRIAVTEASRAQHAAQVITAQESGLASGKRWILSSDACPLCLPLAGKVVPLDEPFTVLDTGGPYDVVHYPPLHPHCRCDMIEVVTGVND